VSLIVQESTSSVRFSFYDVHIDKAERVQRKLVRYDL
jgi:hypothetical protein